MDYREISIGEPIVFDDVTVIPIEKMWRYGSHSGGGLRFYAAKEPVAVIVSRGAFRKIYCETGEEIFINDLVSDFPEQEEYIKEKLSEILQFCDI